LSISSAHRCSHVNVLLFIIDLEIKAVVVANEAVGLEGERRLLEFGIGITHLAVEFFPLGVVEFTIFLILLHLIEFTLLAGHLQ